MGGFQGYGRPRKGPDEAQPMGGANPFFGYVGSEDGNALDVGLGFVNSQNLNALQATGRVGGWSTEAGFQAGAQGQASLFELGGTLGAVARMLGFDASDKTQGGWENFLSLEGHGCKASGDANLGTDGASIGGSAELLGGSAKLGGAEYEFLLGTEIGVGVGVGGAGASFGANWSDDDHDGLREWGLSFGGELGIGVDISAKNELAGRLWQALGG